MKWRNFLTGAAVGFLIGYLLKDEYKKEFISSEKALKIAKNHLKATGKIDGSWIYTIPQDYESNGLSYKVYKVGISRSIEERKEQLEVLIDARTGTILNVQPFTP